MLWLGRFGCNTIRSIRHCVRHPRIDVEGAVQSAYHSCFDPKLGSIRTTYLGISETALSLMHATVPDEMRKTEPENQGL